MATLSDLEIIQRAKESNNRRDRLLVMILEILLEIHETTEDLRQAVIWKGAVPSGSLSRKIPQRGDD